MPPATFEGRAFARAGILGNPSDGYFGKALSVILRDFRASVILEESDDVRIVSSGPDQDSYESLADLVESTRRQGYYGGRRLIKAAIKVFHDHADERGLALTGPGFVARYESTIPRQVGLAGSSAIITATMRALMAFYDVEIPKQRLPDLVLSAEVDELGITAGLQDRVVQVYEGLVYMDFSADIVEKLGHGCYDSLRPSLLPRLFVAYQTHQAKVSGQVLDDVRLRWERGDTEVHEVLQSIAALAERGRDALLAGDAPTFLPLMNENFDLRRRIMHVSERDVAMVEAARSLGATAKLTGSGGAIIGAFEDDETKQQIERRLESLGARVLELAPGDQTP